MVVAMLVGMVVLGLLHDVAWPSLTTRSDLSALAMATDMAIGMSVWMRLRGHSWRGIAEMSASMYAPFVVLLVPHWTGSVGGDALVTWGHVAMFGSMALVMYLRRDEYVQ
jgi:flagellar biosynthetic protein FliP